jgi:hypothetical protein
VGILAFEEVKGIFESDSSSLEQSEKKKHFVQSLLLWIRHPKIGLFGN